ncbi:MAG: hypothetical protein ACRCZF_19865, partial [Gemmataceae bacterium]
MKAERYQGRCTACEYESATRVGREICLLITTVEEDTARAAGAELPLVLHPVMPSVMEEFGLTYPAAAWQGQLVQVRGVVCRSCGELYEKRYLTAGGA